MIPFFGGAATRKRRRRKRQGESERHRITLKSDASKEALVGEICKLIPVRRGHVPYIQDVVEKMTKEWLPRRMPIGAVKIFGDPGDTGYTAIEDDAVADMNAAVIPKGFLGGMLASFALKTAISLAVKALIWWWRRTRQ